VWGTRKRARLCTSGSGFDNALSVLQLTGWSSSVSAAVTFFRLHFSAGLVREAPKFEEPDVGFRESFYRLSKRRTAHAPEGLTWVGETGMAGFAGMDAPQIEFSLTILKTFPLPCNHPVARWTLNDVAGLYLVVKWPVPASRCCVHR